MGLPVEDAARQAAEKAQKERNVFEEDIKIIMQQTHVTRAVAVATYLKLNRDLINALLELKEGW
jgi:NACalpha-BTF3-like transcription factor